MHLFGGGIHVDGVAPRLTCSIIARTLKRVTAVWRMHLRLAIRVKLSD